MDGWGLPHARTPETGLAPPTAASSALSPEHSRSTTEGEALSGPGKKHGMAEPTTPPGAVEPLGAGGTTTAAITGLAGLAARQR